MDKIWITITPISSEDGVIYHLTAFGSRPCPDRVKVGLYVTSAEVLAAFVPQLHPRIARDLLGCIRLRHSCTFNLEEALA